MADGLDGLAILNRAREAYRRAAGYRDQGKIYLSYRLAGQMIREEQPWTTEWSQRAGLAASWFNAELQFDGRMLRCFVYDNESGNLDQQCLLLPSEGKPPIDRLLADGIAAYFVGGRSEMPLDAAALPRRGALIPPVIDWLVGDGEWELFRQPDRVVRLADGLVEQQPCHHIQVIRQSQQCDLWIDRESGVVRQLTLPLAFLDEGVREAPEVEQLQFFARLYGAGFDSTDQDPPVQITLPDGARLVQQFIQLPEPFPCDMLGQALPDLDLVSRTGQAFSVRPFQGRTTVWAWLGDRPLAPFLAQYQGSVQQRSSPLPPQLEMIWTPLGWSGQGESFAAAASQWEALATQQGIQVRCWQDASASSVSQVGLRTFPGLIVVAPDLTVQYAQSLADGEWPRKLAAAVDRIEQGERLADEMRGEYEQFLDRYQRKLQLVSAERLVRGDATATASVSALAPVWHCTELSRPGNLQPHVADPSRECLVFDGWRTIARLGLDGSVRERIALDLPVGEAVSVLRQARQANGECWYLVFSPGGSDAWLFDSQWKRRTTFAISQPMPGPLVDCQFANADSGIEVWVARQQIGIHRFDVEGELLGPAVTGSVDAFATLRGELAVVCNAQLRLATWPGAAHDPLDGGALFPVPFDGRDVVRVAPFGLDVDAPAASTGGPCWIATAADGAGGWQLVRVAQGGVSNSVDIGGQFFDTSVESLFVTPSGNALAIADSIGNIQVFRRPLDELALWSTGKAIDGIAAWESAEGLLVMAATVEGVLAWRIGWP